MQLATTLQRDRRLNTVALLNPTELGYRSPRSSRVRLRTLVHKADLGPALLPVDGHGATADLHVRAAANDLGADAVDRVREVKLATGRALDGDLVRAVLALLRLGLSL